MEPFNKYPRICVCIYIYIGGREEQTQDRWMNTYAYSMGISHAPRIN